MGLSLRLTDAQRRLGYAALPWLARGLWALTLALAVSTIALAAAAQEQLARVAPGLGGPLFATVFFAVFALVALTYATAGLLILRHQVRHAVGWMLLVAGSAMLTLTSTFAISIDLNAQGDPLAGWLVLVSAISWWPVIMLAGPLVALVFPDGRLPSPSWRLPTAAVLGYTLFALLLAAFRPFENGPQNPLAVEGMPASVYQLMDLVFDVGILAPLVLGVAAVVFRVRRAGIDQRQQLKWFVFAVVVWAAIFAVASVAPIGGTAAISVGSLVLIPVAIVVAITRYRLYDIDMLINRTLVYLVLIGIVSGLYAALVLLFQRIFVAVTGDTSDAAAIISALILASVFTPIRKLIEGLVDRWFKAAPDAPAREPDVLDTRAADRNSVVVLSVPEFEAAVERIVRRIMSERTWRAADSRDQPGPC